MSGICNLALSEELRAEAGRSLEIAAQAVYQISELSRFSKTLSQNTRLRARRHLLLTYVLHINIHVHTHMHTYTHIQSKRIN